MDINSKSYRALEQRLEKEVNRLDKALERGEITKAFLDTCQPYQKAVKSLVSIKKSRIFDHAVKSVASGNVVKEHALHYLSEMANGNMTASTGLGTDQLMNLLVLDLADAVKSFTGNEVTPEISKALLTKWYSELKSTDLFKGAVYLSMAIEENDFEVLGDLAKSHFQAALSR